MMKKLLLIITCFFTINHFISGQTLLNNSVSNYTNPVIGGDHADPSILRIGNDYYMTFSSFKYTPGLQIYHSRDLVNWNPVASALTEYYGNVWAPDFIFYNGKFYIYFPVLADNMIQTMVVTADSPEGPWSEAMDVGADGLIDPGHIVDENGQRYLFFNKGQMMKLTDDGLKVTGELRKVYEGWNYPDEWDVECFCLESPKLKKIGDYYYMVVAQGGTAGVPTSHMAAVARSKSIEGPWENSPYNPLVHTFYQHDKWLSTGHGTIFDTPKGDWFVVYHGYENGYRSLGRQTLLEPISWTTDFWPIPIYGLDRAQPIQLKYEIPKRKSISFSDDFSTNKIGTQWQFFNRNLSDRCSFENNTLSIDAVGTKPSNCHPLTFKTGDHAYEIQVLIEIEKGSSGGLILFYNEKYYTGISLSEGAVWTELNGGKQKYEEISSGNSIHFKIKNYNQIVSMFFSVDGREWIKLERSFEVSKYNHNTYGGFLSLRPGIFGAGEGEVSFSNFQYKSLNY